MADDSGSVGPFGEFLRLSATSGVARVRDAAYALRLSSSSPGDLPDRGIVAVEGRIETADEVLRSPVTGARAVLARYRLAALEPDDDRAWVIRDRIDAVPFQVAADGDRVLVDSVPRDVGERLAAGPRSRGRAAYADATLSFPEDARVDHEARVDRVDPDGPLGEFVPLADLPDRATVRYRERRFDPGHRVTVLGHRLHDDRVRPDVGNVAGLRAPFRIRGADPTPGSEKRDSGSEE